MPRLSISRAAALLLLAAACGDSDERAQTRLGDQQHAIALVVDDRGLRAGDTLRVLLINGTAAEVGYNLCPARLERRSGDSWQPVPDQRMCTMELRLLSPSDTALHARLLDSTLAAGEYRVVTTVNPGGMRSSGEVVSPSFTVSARVSP